MSEDAGGDGVLRVRELRRGLVGDLEEAVEDLEDERSLGIGGSEERGEGGEEGRLGEAECGRGRSGEEAGDLVEGLAADVGVGVREERRVACRRVACHVDCGARVRGVERGERGEREGRGERGCAVS